MPSTCPLAPPAAPSHFPAVTLERSFHFQYYFSRDLYLVSLFCLLETCCVVASLVSLVPCTLWSVPSCIGLCTPDSLVLDYLILSRQRALASFLLRHISSFRFSTARRSLLPRQAQHYTFCSFPLSSLRSPGSAPLGLPPCAHSLLLLITTADDISQIQIQTQTRTQTQTLTTLFCTFQFLRFSRRHTTTNTYCTTTTT